MDNFKIYILRAKDVDNAKTLFLYWTESYNTYRELNDSTMGPVSIDSPHRFETIALYTKSNCCYVSPIMTHAILIT